jgi:hypothetical protein
MQFHFLT